MVKALNRSAAKIVVSEYATADSIFKGWNRVEKTTAGRARTGAHKTKARKKTEVLYMNFEPTGMSKVA
jgi:hypothetical protein